MGSAFLSWIHLSTSSEKKKKTLCFLPVLHLSQVYAVLRRLVVVAFMSLCSGGFNFTMRSVELARTTCGRTRAQERSRSLTCTRARAHIFDGDHTHPAQTRMPSTCTANTLFTLRVDDATFCRCQDADLSCFLCWPHVGLAHLRAFGSVLGIFQNTSPVTLPVETCGERKIQKSTPLA